MSTETSDFNFFTIRSISFGDLTTLDTALFLIFLALYANLNVYSDSSKWSPSLLAVHTKVVLEFPPSDSFKKNVSFESLKGTWVLPSVRCMIQFPRAVKLMLIFLASSRTFPVAPVFDIRSLPAKSTRFSWACFVDPSRFFYA